MSRAMQRNNQSHTNTVEQVGTARDPGFDICRSVLRAVEAAQPYLLRLLTINEMYVLSMGM